MHPLHRLNAPGRGARSTACNLQFDADYITRLLDFKDCSTGTLVINNRKQDQERKGHWMRIGMSADPALDINHQLGLLMDLAGTRPSPACTGDRLRDPVPSPACVPAMVVMMQSGHAQDRAARRA